MLNIRRQLLKREPEYVEAFDRSYAQIIERVVSDYYGQATNRNQIPQEAA